MKFSVTRALLLEALSITSKCIASKSIMPMMDNFLFNIDGDILEITGSNNEVYLTTRIEIVGGGFKRSIAVASAQLVGLVKDIPEQPIDFLIEEREVNNMLVYSVSIKAGKGVYKLPAEDGEDYPQIKHEGTLTFQLQSQALLNGISKTLFAVGNNELQPEKTGVLVSFEDGRVTYTATNGHIVSTFSYDVDVESEKSFIVPAKVLSILQSTPADEIITVSLDRRSVSFRLSEDTLLKSILIDAKFPDYKMVIPRNNESHLTINRSEFAGALKRVTKFSNQITNMIRLSITEASLIISGDNIDSGTEAKEELSHSYEGEPIEIGLGGKLLLECLSRNVEEEVNLYFSVPNRPVIIREKEADPSCTTDLMLIAPMLLPS